MESKINYWVEISDYNLETAEAMLQSKRYLYVGFMCRQAIEKILKAYFVKVNSETPPFSHSLSVLAKKANLDLHLSEVQLDFIDQIEPLNIEARYPSHKERILKSLTETKCREILSNTTELQSWIKQRLST